MSESGAQLLARLERGRLKDVEGRLFPEGLQHGDVVEVTGAQGTGKSELLLHLLCSCLLPVCVGGLEVDVLFVDTDFNLDMIRLVGLLDHKLTAAPSDSSSSHDALLWSCLRRLLVVQCSSSSQLLLTLHFLEAGLSSRRGLSLLLFDSMSAFYWLDRQGGGASVSRQEDTLSRCSQLLARLLRDYRLSVVASVHSIRGRGLAVGPSYLCRAWQQLVTQRLVSSRTEGEPATFSISCPRTGRSHSFRVTPGGLEFTH